MDKVFGEPCNTEQKAAFPRSKSNVARTVKTVDHDRRPRRRAKGAFLWFARPQVMDPVKRVWTPGSISCQQLGMSGFIRAPGQQPEWRVEVGFQVDSGQGHPAGGSGCQYFVGHFDGKHFVNENRRKPYCGLITTVTSMLRRPGPMYQLQMTAASCWLG